MPDLYLLSVKRNILRAYEWHCTLNPMMANVLMEHFEEDRLPTAQYEPKYKHKHYLYSWSVSTTSTTTPDIRVSRTMAAWDVKSIGRIGTYIDRYVNTKSHHYPAQN